MKTDARIRYTKMVIQKSFFELMKENPVNKITVKSICELSEINRATFYKYYTDPFDLMRQIENGLVLKMQELIEAGDNIDITQTLVVILSAIKRNAETYTLLISENGDSHFFNRVLLDSFKIKNPSIQMLLPDMLPNYQEWFFNFMACGCAGIIINWVHSGMKEEPLEVAEFVNKLNNIMLKGIR